MEFPRTAKKIIAQTFYDKEIKILEKQDELNSEGGIISKITSCKATFKGNVRFVSGERVQSGLGLVKRGDIQITCSTGVKVDLNDIVSYAGVQYTIIELLPADSHLTIVGKRLAKTEELSVSKLEGLSRY